MTIELLGVLPVANAFGILVLMTAILGFGRLFLATMRSTRSCSSGNCSLFTIFAPVLHRTILSEKYHCAIIMMPAIAAKGIAPTPT